MANTPTKYLFERFPRKKEVSTAEHVETVEALASAIKSRLDALLPVSTVEPDTVNKILARQNTIVENMNSLKG